MHKIYPINWKQNPCFCCSLFFTFFCAFCVFPPSIRNQTKNIVIENGKINVLFVGRCYPIISDLSNNIPSSCFSREIYREDFYNTKTKENKGLTNFSFICCTVLSAWLYSKKVVYGYMQLWDVCSLPQRKSTHFFILAKMEFS